jgi:hypothetical protein
MIKNKKIKNATVTIYNGITFRSKLEAECAKILDEEGIKYQYEPFKIVLLPSFKYLGKTLREWSYSPDFVIFNNVIIEVKGFPNDVWGYKKKMILKYIVDHNYIYEFYEVKNKTQLRTLIKELKAKNNENT